MTLAYSIALGSVTLALERLRRISRRSGWLMAIDHYRVALGVASVVVNASRSDGIRLHGSRRYTATLTQHGVDDLTWSFYRIGYRGDRLRAGSTTRSRLPPRRGRRSRPGCASTLRRMGSSPSTRAAGLRRRPLRSSCVQAATPGSTSRSMPGAMG